MYSTLVGNHHSLGVNESCGGAKTVSKAILHDRFFFGEKQRESVFQIFLDESVFLIRYSTVRGVA